MNDAAKNPGLPPRVVGVFVTVAFVIAAALGVTIGLQGSAADAEGMPDRPAWVNDDGSVNEDMLPSTVPMVDERGRVIEHVKPAQGPPPLPPASLREGALPGDARVLEDGSVTEEARPATR